MIRPEFVTITMGTILCPTVTWAKIFSWISLHLGIDGVTS
jgi:hypothetical protein